MKITKALMETGKASLDNWGYNEHVILEYGQYTFVSKEGNESAYGMTALFDNNWQSYPKVTQIVPEKAGELWLLGICEFFTIFDNDVDICLKLVDGTGDRNPIDQEPPMIHNQNGWKLLYSPDPEKMAMINPVEEDVERIEIDGVTLAALITEAPHANTVGGWNTFMTCLRGLGMEISAIPKESL